MQAEAKSPRKLRRFPHQLLRDRERRAGRDRELHHSALVLEPREPLCVGEDLVDRLDEGVRRQTAVRDPEVHRPAGGDDPQAELPRRLHLGLPEPGPAAREHVVVVEDGRAARQRELREPGPGGRVLGLGVDLRPHGVQLAQPLEQRCLLRPGARQRLVQVVMGVDEPGRDDRSAEVDHLVRGRRRAPADSFDEAVPDEHPAALVLGAGIVQRADPAVLQEHRHARATIPRVALPVRSAGVL